MTDMDRKVAHVKAAKQTRAHHCHWPDCKSMVPPAMWGCRGHWFKLPKSIRTRIWQNYVTGQEVTRRPSAAYLAVAREAEDFARNYIRKQKEQARLFP